ncbi:DUF983 domain-containing protein [Methylopila sp. M107]|uniref:DUF983 domain-containing protein n=1 Tax=Methylopila sp. M107 TaxID=1101190 RepID=UPI000363A33C|nr:DUF983 domain-containing protein [Methylopila sp. M107]
MSETTYRKLEPYNVGVRGRCPRCGEGHMFEGFLKLKPECEVCGLDYSYADPADGPAFFAITFACLPSALFAVWLELAYQAPYWVHIFTTLPIMLVTLLPPLRPLKGWLVASQYYHKASEARLVKLGEAEDKTGW